MEYEYLCTWLSLLVGFLPMSGAPATYDVHTLFSESLLPIPGCARRLPRSSALCSLPTHPILSYPILGIPSLHERSDLILRAICYLLSALGRAVGSYPAVTVGMIGVSVVMWELEMGGDGCWSLFLPSAECE